MYRRLMFIFELASNFISAHEDVDILELLHEGPVAYQLALEKNRQLQDARSTLSQQLPVFPELARSLKTRVSFFFCSLGSCYCFLFTRVFFSCFFPVKVCHVSCVMCHVTTRPAAAVVTLIAAAAVGTVLVSFRLRLSASACFYLAVLQVVDRCFPFVLGACVRAYVRLQLV